MQITENEPVSSAIEAVASDPRIAGALAGSTTALGAAAWFNLIQGWLSVISMCVGIVTGIAVLGIQLIRLEKAWRERAKSQS